MAPTASTNSLCFSLPNSMEMLPASQPPSHPFFLDHFYTSEWVNSKAGTEMYAADEQSNAAARESNLMDGYLELEPHIHPQTVPKLEDFLGGNTTSSLNTQDDSQIYDPNAVTSAIALPEVHDSASMLAVVKSGRDKSSSFGHRTSIY